VFALAVMQLVQEGKLDLDEDVNEYLKSWEIPANVSWQPKVTLRQLLSHSAGLSFHGFPGYETTDDIPSVIQILNGQHPSNTPAVQVNLIPGLQCRYSGGGKQTMKFNGIPVLTRNDHEVIFLTKFTGPQVYGEVYVPVGVYQGRFKLDSSGQMTQHALINGRLGDFTVVEFDEFIEIVKAKLSNKQ
jgi:hypothetical protein